MAWLSYFLVYCCAMIIGISLIFAQEKYDGKYDDIDAKAILEDPKQQMEWYKCFIKVGPCLTPAEQYFADILPEAYQTQCQKCTEKQKNLLKLLIEWYTKNEPELLQALVAHTEQQFKNNGGQ